MDTIDHTVESGFCTVCGETEDWINGAVDDAAPEGVRMSAVKHDDAHSLRVDRVLMPGETALRTFWCTCGHSFGAKFDSPARAAYRAHRKVSA